jgi:NADH-quinone oxidoreductase subunit A
MMAAISAALIHLVPAAEAAPVVAAAVPAAAPVLVMGPSVFDMVFPLTMLLILGLLLPAALLGINTILSRFSHGTRNTNPAKNEPYESGLPVTVGTAGERFDVKFYLIAMLFLAFDIEVAFLYPWAVHFSSGGWEMIALLVVFLVLLEVGYLYLYKKGALDWDK